MEVLAEVVGEVTIHYLLPFLLDRVVERRDRRGSDRPERATRSRVARSLPLQLVASSSGVEVVSRAPGRVRARVADLRGNDYLAESLTEALSAVAGVRAVQASAITGTILVCYDPARESAERLLRAIADVRAARAVTTLYPRDDDPVEIGLALVGS